MCILMFSQHFDVQLIFVSNLKMPKTIECSRFRFYCRMIARNMKWTQTFSFLNFKGVSFENACVTALKLYGDRLATTVRQIKLLYNWWTQTIKLFITYEKLLSLTSFFNFTLIVIQFELNNQEKCTRCLSKGPTRIYSFGNFFWEFLQSMNFSHWENYSFWDIMHFVENE